MLAFWGAISLMAQWISLGKQLQGFSLRPPIVGTELRGITVEIRPRRNPFRRCGKNFIPIVWRLNYRYLRSVRANFPHPDLALNVSCSRFV